jgi:hypothetical protein
MGLINSRYSLCYVNVFEAVRADHPNTSFLPDYQSAQKNPGLLAGVKGLIYLRGLRGVHIPLCSTQ